MNLYDASTQWSSRPPDERFDSIEMLEAACTQLKEVSVEHVIPLASIGAKTVGDEGIVFETPDSGEFAPTNYAFEQMCHRTDYPSRGIVGKLSNHLATQVINHRINKTLEEKPDARCILLSNRNTNVVRSITSEKYSRIYNADLIPFLYRLQRAGWKVPPARPIAVDQPGSRLATDRDVIGSSDFGLNIKPGDLIAPAGLYAGDRDMFAFMVNPNFGFDDGNGNKMMKGMFLRNSEVGDGSVSITSFMVANVCGNHICWDVNEIVKTRLRHVGDAYQKVLLMLNKAMETLCVFSEPNITPIANWLRQHEVALEKEDVIDYFYEMKVDTALTRKVLVSGYEMAEQFNHIDGGTPNTPWGIVQGLTRHSQTLPYANARQAVDMGAGRLLNRFSGMAKKELLLA